MYIILSIIIVIVLGGIYYYNLVSKPASPVILQYSCANTAGFVFNYPSFKDAFSVGSYSKIMPDSGHPEFCHLYLSQDWMSQNIETQKNAPSIEVKKLDPPGKPAEGSPVLKYPPANLQRNPQSVPYQVTSAADGRQHLMFYADSFAADISFVGDAKKLSNFSQDILFKEIISSFRLN